MRIEELQNNLYIKSTDTVEKYLLNIIKEYFRDSNEALEGSREFIIREAVERLKTEMDYNALGVLSITLPNGEVKTGDVYLSLEELNGEPLISTKLSAFNVDFGDGPNTACEGNDYRLSNARMPLKHEHEISDILGLEGQLSSVITSLDRQGSLNHEHSNLSVLNKLKYTGTNDTIDLTIIDTLKPHIEDLFEQIQDIIAEYKSETQNSIGDINTNLTEINQELASMKTYVNNKCEEALNSAKEYTDDKIDDTIQTLKDFMDNNYVIKSDIEDLIDIAKNCYTLASTEEWNLYDLYLQLGANNKEITLQLSNNTLTELQRRNTNIGDSNIILDFSIEYTINNIVYKQPLPFVDKIESTNSYLYPLVPSYTMNGFVQNISIVSNRELKLQFKTNPGSVLINIINDRNSKIVCDVYTKDYARYNIS